jgi:hypothetical protein
MRPDTDVFAMPRWWQSGRQGATLAVRHANPGWFTSVMGTGILALCAALSPVALPMLRQFSMLLWLGAVILLVCVTLCWLAQTIQQPQRLRLSLADPVSAQFWGAPPIACFTIATGFLVIGPHLLNAAWCIAIAQVLWILGVIGSLFVIAVAAVGRAVGIGRQPDPAPDGTLCARGHRSLPRARGNDTARVTWQRRAIGCRAPYSVIPCCRYDG